ncbi:DDE-1 domain containing protein [Pyrenophora tritici-repentis]|uniref:DDE-1 domain containing protein n=2 Tax=Pyrenophora tritici-repentis TaxID=45151 RepID=A0A922T1B2_9PLEO|nr:DDE-1 domain containing protein [Pyrenophora tritici-repentis]
MDEKGFMIGVTGRSKRVFDKRIYDRKGITAAVQDGSREWVTVLACICSDGTALSPALIFQSAAGALQSSWTDAINKEKHQVFIGSSPSGWTNNDIGLAWLKEVFERETRWKARSGYRLLLLDGHGSHVTMDFINYCNDHKILLLVFPPHATHTLQPLDVGMFKPLSTAYSTELSSHLYRSQGLIPVTKGDFFPLFWSAWAAAFKPQTIMKSFEATGIHPPNAEVILRRFRKEASSSDESSTSVLSAEDWLKIKTLISRQVRDKDAKDTKKIYRSLHHISAQLSILSSENRDLKEALLVKKRHRKKSYTLNVNNNHEYYGGALLWSPRKVHRARDDEAVRQQQKQQEQLQKAERSQMKEQARLYRLHQAQEKRVEKERLKEVREKERAAKEAEKERQKATRDAEKAIQLSQKGKRKASQASKLPRKRQKRAVVVPSHVQAEEAASAAPARTTRLGRKTKLPSKYK